MTVDEVIKYFGSCAEISRKLGIGMMTPHLWKKKGKISLRMQCKINLYTKGALKITENKK